MDSSHPSPPLVGTINNTDSHFQINELLRKSQGKIIQQISSTQSLIYRQLIATIFLTISMLVFLAPFLLFDQTPRKIAMGVLIMCYFFMSFYSQIHRKLPHMKGSHKFLHRVKQEYYSTNSAMFFQNVTQYMVRLYDLLFFDTKSNRVSCEFLESSNSEKITELEKSLMKSLKIDRFINIGIGMFYLIGAVCALVLMQDRVEFYFSIGMFLVICFCYVFLIQTCVKLERTLTTWMQAFINLRTWIAFIENLDGPTIEPSIPEPEPSESSKCFCPNCGKENQEYGLYCQQCGRKIEEK